MMKKIEMKAVDRRDFIRMAGTGAIAALASSMFPGQARADKAMVDELMKKLFGDKKVTPGKVTLELPQIAENGRTVPMAFEVVSPMTDNDYVKTVHIFAEKNPRPEVAAFHFTPACGKARVATRMRLGGTQNVIAVAEMSDGSVYIGKSTVKVTIGGCGG